MHTLLFLAPGTFHAALTLRVPQARAADEIFVYAREGAELRDFLALVERFNRRSPNPTRWRPIVTTADDPLGRLVEERRGDVVILAGRNGGKARTIRRLHESGFHVLADKPWLVEPGDLEHVRASLDGWPLATELLSARAWSTRVPAEAFRRITGEAGFPRELEPFVDGATLSYRCNAELVYQVGRVTVSAATRWNLVPLPGGGDASHSVAHGTRADIRLEQSARTDHHRRLFLEPRTDAGDV